MQAEFGTQSRQANRASRRVARSNNTQRIIWKQNLEANLVKLIEQVGDELSNNTQRIISKQNLEPNPIKLIEQVGGVRGATKDQVRLKSQ